MATIQPFRAIRPNPLYAGQLVFTGSQAESVAGDEQQPGALPPLKTLLETGARQRPETPEGQERAYREIRDHLQGLIAGERLVQEPAAGIYIYEHVHRSYRQTGVWALTALSDYRDGVIKTHELTFADSVRRLKNYRRHTGLEGSPVLLAYPANETINALIAGIKAGEPKMTLGNRQGLHRLWKTEDPRVLQQLTAAFGGISTTYLADGHHRLESAAELAGEQTGSAVTAYDTISSLYMATDQLQLREYDRVVLTGQLIDPPELFRALNKDFVIGEAAGNRPVRPGETHRLGLYLYGQWYHLLARAHTYENRPVTAAIDAAILQERVLAPLFGINDPGSDARLKCAGGEKAMEEVGALLRSHPGAIAFTLFPLTVEELVGVAEAGEVLPPKSTWIDPKVPYGLLLHQHS